MSCQSSQDFHLPSDILNGYGSGHLEGKNQLENNFYKHKQYAAKSEIK